METKNNNKTNKIRQILVLILLPFTLYLLPFTPIFAQSADQNYIVTQTYTSPTAHNDVIRYYDGLGRPIETVQKQFTPNGKDLVTRLEYDNFGRESKAWLPVYNNNSNGAFDNTTGVSSAYGGDGYAYSETKYEPSPLNRINEQYGPGASWRSGTGHKIKTEYMANKLPANDSTLACAYYHMVAGNNSGVQKSGYYAAGTLYVTKTTDEDNNVSYEFKDKLGQVLLHRKIADGKRYDTYYVYNDSGNLTTVLPPIASDNLKADQFYDFWGTYENTFLEAYATHYGYDSRNRMADRKKANTDVENFIYDRADRLVMHQTAAADIGFGRGWIFYKYDALGRVILSGTYHGDDNNTNVNQKAFNMRILFENNNILSVETAVNIPSQYHYTWNVFPSLSSVEVTQVNYYDNYDYAAAGYGNLSYQTKAGYGEQWSSAKGLLTGTRSRILGGNGTPEQWITTVYYYDYRGNIVQKRSTNQLGGYDCEYYAYNYNSLITKKHMEHNTSGQSTVTEEYIYNYDTQLRLTGVTHSLNNGTPATIAQYAYNSLGQLLTKTTGGLETATYAYNLRGWETSQTGSRFSENLYYTENPKSGGNKYYGGNIAALTWKSPASNSTPRGYSFEYNSLGWLKEADYGEGSALSDNTERYSERFSYDKMGNPLSIKRYGRREPAPGNPNTHNFGLIDDLSMPEASYIGNSLRQVDDAAGDLNYADLMEFKDGINNPGEYINNSSGELMADYNRKICMFKYNYLLLPQSVQFRYGHRIEYTYDASGMKRSVKYREANHNMNYYTWDDREPAASDFIPYQHHKDYTGNKVYEDGQLKLILTENGYIEKTGNTYTRYYYLQDRLGNNRIVMNASGTAVQQTNYYPSGVVMAESPVREDQGVQPYKFGSKELDRSHGLDFYDFEARQYDPTIMRFTVPDPLQEKYYSISPYAYCGNNPVNRIDPTGMDWYVLTDEGKMLLALKTEDKQDRLYYSKMDKEGNKNVAFINVTDQDLLSQLAENPDAKSYNAVTSNATDAFNVFKVASDASDFEWSLSGFKDGGKTKFYLNTEHSDGGASVGDGGSIFKTPDMIFNVHSHSKENGTKGGSGYIYDLHGKLVQYSPLDDGYIAARYHKRMGDKMPKLYVYHRYTQNLYQYAPWSHNIGKWPVGSGQRIKNIVNP
ncbi:hypothetical protein AGMMS50239_09740 [Bacteroidia bacterium]|nr:hypothetical protein AGMMS50239_09740 [Bacteroidia bacterium]